MIIYLKKHEFYKQYVFHTDNIVFHKNGIEFYCKFILNKYYIPYESIYFIEY